MAPIGNGDGRDADSGKFLRGNRAAAGHNTPNAATVARLRAAVFASVTPERIQAVCEKLLSMAEGGDVAAAKLILNYCIGAAERVQWAATSDEPAFSDLAGMIGELG